MSIGIILATFFLVGLAELPDKTMIATIIMGSRSRPALVWIGTSCAFVVHVTLAVAAGRLIELLPQRTVDGVVAFLFLAGAAYLFFVPEKAEVIKGTAEADAGESGQSRVAAWPVIATAFGVVLIGEFGDLTQLLTVNLVARFHQPYAVFVGALSGLLVISAAGAFGGQALLKLVSVGTIRKIGGVALLGFAAYSIYALIH